MRNPVFYACRKMFCLSFIFSLLVPFAYADQVDIIANWDAEHDVPAIFDGIRKKSRVNFFSYRGANFSFSFPVSNDVKKIFVFNPYLPASFLSQFPKEKLVLFVWEPEVLPKSYYELFSRVYTWDDSLIDRVKFFRFNYPHLREMEENLPAFEARKLCTLISRNWQPHRVKVLRFFQTRPEAGFEFYGWQAPFGFQHSSMYKGPIYGSYCGREKIDVLKQYRFCMCFENSIHLQGYITEKIFACFAAGTIPIYLGATNIGSHIPENCFIDFRAFHDMEELYQFIKNMPKQVYQGYLDNIKKYLSSEEAKEFSPRHFSALLEEEVAS